MKKLIFFTIVLSGIIFIYSSTADSSRSSILSLANLEALAGTTPGEEKPSESGTWYPASEKNEEFIRNYRMGNYCYNDYKVNQYFKCESSGCSSSVCGSTQRGVETRPCDC